MKTQDEIMNLLIEAEQELDQFQQEQPIEIGYKLVKQIGIAISKSKISLLKDILGIEEVREERHARARIPF
jgi:sporulation protein YlmC with PRC-barrel domain